MQSLMSQTQVSNVQIRVEEEEDNSWVFHILEDLVTAMLDDGLHLKSLDTAGSGNSSIDWASRSPPLLAKFLIILEEGRFNGNGQT